MMEISNFSVVIWLTKTDNTSVLKARLISIASEMPDETTEYMGFVDCHWWFDTYEPAERLAEAFAKISAEPDIIVLRLSDNKHGLKTKTFKDRRIASH